MMYEWWFGKDAYGSGRGLILGAIPAFACKNWENQGKDVKISSIEAEIWTMNIPNTEDKC
jgi:hypothetical protein